jgi:hypothetical protein
MRKVPNDIIGEKKQDMTMMESLRNTTLGTSKRQVEPSAGRNIVVPTDARMEMIEEH